MEHAGSRGKRKSRLTLLSKCLIFFLAVHVIQTMAYSPMTTAAPGNEMSAAGTGVVVFGKNDVGQLGVANPPWMDVILYPTAVSSLSNITQVAAGEKHSLALDADFKVYGIGSNTFGQLGSVPNANDNSMASPVEIAGLPQVKSIAAGKDYSMALSVTGSVYMFGSLSFGDSNVSYSDPTPTPTLINEELPAMKAIAAGPNRAFMVAENGDVYALGKKDGYLLGVPGTGYEHTPIQVSLPGGAKAVDVSVGEDHNLVLTENGIVYGFGLNQNGALGSSNIGNSSGMGPTLMQGFPGGTTFFSISAGDRYSLFATADGIVYGMGLNVYNTLGIDSTMYSQPTAPIQITGLENVTSVIAGYTHSLAITADGSVYSFGQGLDGRLGQGQGYDNYTQATPKKIVGMTGSAVAIGGGNSNGFTVVAGEVNSSVTSSSTTFDKHPERQANILITATLRGNVVRGITYNGNTLQAMTDYRVSESGYQITINKSYLAGTAIGIGDLAVTFSGGEDQIVKITVSESPVPDFSQDGLFVFGKNDYNQLGLADGNNHWLPHHLNAFGGNEVVDVDSGYRHTLVLTSDGSVYSFGNGNGSGVLGQGDSNHESTPKRIEGLTQAVSIAAGGIHSLVLTADGKVYAFGAGYSGQLGDGEFHAGLNVPTQIENLPPIKAIAAGSEHSILLSEAGDVYTFGGGYIGQLGQGKFYVESNDYGLSVPTKMMNLPKIKSIAAGYDHSILLSEEGKVYTFGGGYSGQLGDGNFYEEEQNGGSASPILLTNLPSMKQIAANGDHTLLLSLSGEVYAFGYGGAGQLGQGVFYGSEAEYGLSVPTKIESLPKIKKITSGMNHSLFLSAAGEIYASGSNNSGEVGQDTRDYSKISTPTRITQLSNVVNIAAGYNQSFAVVKHHVLDSSLDLSTATFDKYGPSQVDISVEVQENGNKLAFIHDGQHVLIAGTDYTEDGTSITINASYLSQLAVGTTELTFEFSEGADQTVTVTISDSTPPGGNGSSGNTSGGGAVLPVHSTNGQITVPSGSSGSVSLDNAVTVMIPAGASNRELRVTIEKLANTSGIIRSELMASPVYEMLKNVAGNFDKPVVLSFVFDKSKVKQGQSVAIFYYDEVNKKWVSIGGEVSGNQVTADVDHFTKFAVLVVDEKTGQLVDETAETVEEPSFSDIAGHWAETNIEEAAKLGITGGYPDGSFQPEAQITRAEFAVMLANALKLEAIADSLAFTDWTSIGKWARTSVAANAEVGIIKGYEDGSFRPNASITRAELAVMIARAYGSDYAENAKSDYADQSDIPQWAVGPIASIESVGIVQGRDGNRFAPNDTATRAEAVTMILRLLQVKS
ncbi:RCC1 domain-containing protein [Paenibacillus sp. strain BS8-2]